MNQAQNNVNVAAVTGAGGSLGQALVRRLLARGLKVRGLVRSAQDAEALEALGAEPLRGDLRDAARLERLLSGAGVAFHLAAWMGKPFDPALAHAVNVEGTRMFLRVAAKAGVTRVVLASSVAVYGPVTEGRISENSPYWSVGDLYSDTKIEAEKVAKAEAQALGLELVILQPTMIYGPASPAWTETPFQSIKKGLPIILGSGEDLADAVYVEDVARAFELAGFAPAADVAGESFIIAGEAVSWNRFFGYYARMAGTSLRRVPAALARGGAGLAAAATRLLGKPAQVVPEMVGVMTSRARFSQEKARERLGYAPTVELDEGMRRTERWLRESGALPSAGGAGSRAPVALVTGAASGLGREVALGLKARGLDVYASDLSAEALSDLAERGLEVLELDVTSQVSVARAVAAIRERSGPVEVLVNVAGLARPGALEVQAWEDVALQFEVNAFGPLRLARAVAPEMRARGYGRILNVSSTNGFVVTPFMGAYSASKYALEALSDALRLELRPWGVEVSLIEPGAMKTPFAERAQASLQREAETSEAWRGYLEAFRDSPMWGTGNATDPAKVAAVIVKAALGKRAPARVLATLDAVPSRVVSLLPAAVKDGLFRRLSGLHRAPGAAAAAGASDKAASPPEDRAEKTGSS